MKYGLWPAQEIDKVDLNAAMPRDELLAILNAWLRKHDQLNDVTGKIAALDGRRMTLKADGKLTAYTLPANIPIFRRLGDRYEEYANVPVMVGDRAVIQLNARRVPVAAIVVANYDGASFDRTSSFANWTRSYRADELAASINKRFPIQQLLDLRPVTIDASQRIAELEYTAEGGRKFTAKGLPIRWSLNVPDNLFVIEKTKDPDGDGSLHVLRQRLGPRRRDVPGRRVRDGVPRLEVRPDPEALLHRDRDRADVECRSGAARRPASTPPPPVP